MKVYLVYDSDFGGNVVNVFSSLDTMRKYYDGVIHEEIDNRFFHVVYWRWFRFEEWEVKED